MGSSGKRQERERQERKAEPAVGHYDSDKAERAAVGAPVVQSLLTALAAGVVVPSAVARSGLEHLAGQSGNTAAVAVVQRQQIPPPPSTPPVSAAEQKRRLYASTVLREVPPVDAATRGTLTKAVGFAPVFGLIEDRNKLRGEAKAAEKAANDATTARKTLGYSQQDESGARTDGKAAEMREATQKEQDTALEAERLAGELSKLDIQIKSELKRVGVKDEDELVTFVTKTFPEKFNERAMAIIDTDLDMNKRMAEQERDRYFGGDPKDRAGLREAAKTIVAKQQQLADIYATRTTTLPPGGADANDPGVQEHKRIMDQTAPIQTQLDEAKARAQIKYPILLRIDAAQVATANDAQLKKVVDGPVSGVLSSIEKTRSNIHDGSLKTWSLQVPGIDVIDQTKQDLGVESNPILAGVVDKRIQAEKQEGETVKEALVALGMLADVIGVLTGPVGMIVAAGVNAAIAVTNLAMDASHRIDVENAQNVALDPDFAKMVDEDPSDQAVLLGLAELGLSIVGMRAAISEFRALRAAAKDLAELEKAIKATRLEPKVQDRLVQEARRQFAIKPSLLLNAKEVTNEAKQVAAATRTAERVRIARIINKHAESTYTKAYLELAESGALRSLTKESLETAGLAAAKLKEYTAKYVTGPNAKLYGGFVHPGPPRLVFIKPGNETHVAEAAVHELTHVFQRHDSARFLDGPGYFYYQEHQAYLAQQQFLRRIEAEHGIEAVPETSRWLLTADANAMGEHIAKYPGRPAPVAQIPVDDAQLLSMLDEQLLAQERVRKRLLESAGRIAGGK